VDRVARIDTSPDAADANPDSADAKLAAGGVADFARAEWVAGADADAADFAGTEWVVAGADVDDADFANADSTHAKLDADDVNFANASGVGRARAGGHYAQPGLGRRARTGRTRSRAVRRGDRRGAG
jgi:hypothetical protein